MFLSFKPKKNESFTLYFSLQGSNSPWAAGWQSSGLLCSISKDGGAFSYSTNPLEKIRPNYYSLSVKIVLTADEMNADNVLLCISGNTEGNGSQYEWFSIYTTTETSSVDLTPVLNAVATVDAKVVAVNDDVDSVLGAVATVDAKVVGVNNDVDSVYTSVSSLNEVFTGADTELSAIPNKNSPLVNKIKALFQYFFNKRSTTASEMSLYKDNDVTVLGTSTISDNGTTVIKGKIS